MAKMGQGMSALPVFSSPGSVFSRGDGGILPPRGSRAQADMVQQLLASGAQSAKSSGSPLLAFLAPMVGGAVGARTDGLYKDAQAKRDDTAIDTLLAAMNGSGATTGGFMSTQGPDSETRRIAAMAAHGGPTRAAAEAMNSGARADPVALRQGLIERGLPAHIADGFVMNFADESGFQPGINEMEPLIPGSRGGFGLYQLTGPRRRRYEAFAAERGVAASDVNAQLDFLMMELEGSESDAAAKIMDTSTAGEAGAAIVEHFLRPSKEHRERRATDYLGGASNSQGVAGPAFSSTSSAGSKPAGMSESSMRDLIGLMTNTEVSEPIRELAATMLTQGMADGGEMSDLDRLRLERERIGLQGDMLDLEQAMQPPGQFRVATPEEAARNGAEAGQIGPDGRFYPASASNSGISEAALLRQQNEATTIVEGALADLMITGLSRDDALAEIARDPVYARQMEILSIDPAEIARQKVERDAATAQQELQQGWWRRTFGGGGPASASQTPASADNDPLGIR